MEYADLEISLHRRDAGIYGLDLRLVDAANEVDRRLRSTATIRFDTAALRQLHLDPAAYGAALAQQLMAGDAVRAFVGEALATAEAQAAPLGLRLAEARRRRTTYSRRTTSATTRAF